MSAPETFALQNELVMYCRTGTNEPVTTKQENTHHYRRLVINLVRDILTKAYPFTKELFGKENWEKAVKHFFATHKCQTAQVWKMPKEFYEFYSINSFPFDHNCSYVSELLLFEWTELEVFMMEDEDIFPFSKEGTREKDIFVSNPEIRIMPLSFPIHKKKILKITKEDKGQYFAIFVRNHETKKVKYHDINYPMAEMLIRMNDEPTTMRDLTDILSKYEKDANKQLKLVGEFLDFSLKYNLILGFHQPKIITS